MRLTYSLPESRAALAVAMSALIMLGATSCGDGLGPGSSDGTGSVAASGAVTASGDGLAIFQSISSSGIDLFQIAVAPTTPSGAVWQLQIVRYAQRPTVGTYQLTALSASSPDPTANFYYSSAGTMETFNATSGELVITSSSATAVRGTFTFTATSTTNSARSVNVQGSFAALCPPGMTCL
jgi:hypothetical protein